MRNKIKFKHAEEGEILVNDGSTALSGLFAIGAISLASKTIYETDKVYTEYATDSEGLELVSMKAGEALTFLHDATHSIGVLLAYADANEIQSKMNSIAWLIAGLGELSEMVSMTQSEIDFSIKSKQA